MSVVESHALTRVNVPMVKTPSFASVRMVSPVMTVVFQVNMFALIEFNGLNLKILG